MIGQVSDLAPNSGPNWVEAARRQATFDVHDAGRRCKAADRIKSSKGLASTGPGLKTALSAPDRSSHEKDNALLLAPRCRARSARLLRQVVPHIQIQVQRNVQSPPSYQNRLSTDELTTLPREVACWSRKDGANCVTTRPVVDTPKRTNPLIPASPGRASYSCGVIVDAFLANDETALVVFRLEYLKQRVDKFYIGECRFTFSGASKPLVFRELVEVLRATGAEVECVELTVSDELLRGGNRWAIEESTRDSFLTAVARQHREDLILFCDVDEIPSLAQIDELHALGDALSVSSIRTPLYYRRANWLVNSDWQAAKALLGRHASPGVRYANCQSIQAPPGAHFSYLGLSSEQIRDKYRAFSHSELDHDESSSVDLIAFADSYRISHTGGAKRKGLGLLKTVKAQDLGDVERFALARHADWFEFSPCAARLPRRLAASWLLTEIVTCGGRVQSDAGSLEALLKANHKAVWRFLLADMVRNVARQGQVLGVRIVRRCVRRRSGATTVAN